METKHLFRFWLKDKDNGINPALLMKEISGFDGFKRSLSNLAEKSCDSKRFYQSGLQSFVEFCINYDSNYYRIQNYIPTKYNTHKLGVYGIGKRDEDVITVMCAFNGNDYLTSGKDKITQYFAESCYVEGFSLDANSEIFNIFTDAIDVNEKTKEMFVIGKKTRIYNVEDFKRYDGDVAFWEAYTETLSVKETTSLQENFELYDDDKKICDILDRYEKGKIQVICPTAYGKGEISIEDSRRRIERISFANPGQKLVFIYVAPRINLTEAQIFRMVNRTSNENLKKITFIGFCSGEDISEHIQELEKTTKEVITTLSLNVLNKKLCEKDGHFYIATTYHSIAKVLAFLNSNEFSLREKNIRIPIPAMYCDESHNIVKGRSIPETTRECVINEEMTKCVSLVVHFTATQAKSEDPNGKGMNNEKLFGPVVVKVSPKEAIEKGRIVRPMLCFADITREELKKYHEDKPETEEEIFKNTELSAFIVVKSFWEVEKKNKEMSRCPEENATQILVSCNGGHQYRGILHSKELESFRKENPGVKICGVSSDWGVWIDGKEFVSDGNTKNNFFNYMDKLSSRDRAIIFHIAMMGEGCDIKSFNSTLTFPEQSDITCSQTFGRAMRLHLTDRNRLKNGEISPSDWDDKKMIKPCSWNVLPRIGGCLFRKGMMAMMIRKIKLEYNYYPFEIINTDDTGDSKVISYSMMEDEKRDDVIPNDMEVEFRYETEEEERRKLDIYNRYYNERYSQIEKEDKEIMKEIMTEIVSTQQEKDIRVKNALAKLSEEDRELLKSLI